MKKIILSLLTISALSLGAVAQSAPLFTGTTGSVADRVADAKNYLTDPRYAVDAVIYVQRFGTPLESSSMANAILADPTLGGVISTMNQNLPGLVSFTLSTTIPRASSDPDAQLAALAARQSAIPSALTDVLVTVFNNLRNLIIIHKAQGLVNKLKYADAIALLSSTTFLGDGNSNVSNEAVHIITQAKTSLLAADALGWAKVQYYLTPFAASQDGINAVAKALRGADLNLVRSNAFIQFQKDGQGSNVLDSIPVPQLVTNNLAPSTPAHQAVIALMSGDKVGALRVAFGVFGNANTNNDLNAAVSLVAQTLRNVDGNLVRANAFVTAQKNGQAFTISELQQ